MGQTVGRHLETACAGGDGSAPLVPIAAQAVLG